MKDEKNNETYSLGSAPYMNTQKNIHCEKALPR